MWDNILVYDDTVAEMYICEINTKLSDKYLNQILCNKQGHQKTSPRL